MLITRKKLIGFAAVVVALFVIANPLGDSKHGLGKHNAFYADLGQGVWVAFLVGAVALVVLAIVAAVQHSGRTKAARR